MPLGCEAAAHATRLYLQSMPSNYLLLKLDYRNAFNTMRRDKMLLAVCETAPELFDFISTRLYLQSMPSNYLLLKLDYRNAFNTMRRDKMLLAVCETAPELFDFISAAYEHPSFLFCGDHTLESAEGVAARRSSWSTAVLPNHPTTASEASVSFQCFLSG